MPTGCVKSVATRVLGWRLKMLTVQLKMLQAEKVEVKNEKEKALLEDKIRSVLKEIERVRKALAEVKENKR